MLRLLCPTCLQWREPSDGNCLACGGPVELSIPDPSLEELAQSIGDWRASFGAASLSGNGHSTIGILHATAQGLLFIPQSSVVIILSERTPQPRSVGQRLRFRCGFWWSKLTGRCAQWWLGEISQPLKLADRNGVAVAQMLLRDPQVVFLPRSALLNWRHERGRWEFDGAGLRCLPERFTLHDASGARQLAQWLEATACPLQTTPR